MNRLFAHLIAGTALAALCDAACGGEADAAVVRFDIQRFEVSGNTLLPAAQVAQLLAPFAGRNRDFGDVQRALEALEAAYHARGYKVVTIELPEQELQRGVVLLKVVQTSIGKVKVKDNRYFDEANIRRSLPALREGQAPDLNQISASLKLANENPAKKVSLRLQSGDQDDEVDAVLDVSDERAWKGMLNIDNTGTEATGKTHLGLVLQNANLFGRDHVASLQYTTSAERPGRVKVYGAGYHVPLYGRGDSLDFYASYSNVDSGTVAAGVFNLAVSGKGAVYGGRYNQYLAKRGNYEAKLSYGADYKAFKNDVELLGQQSGQQLGNDVTVHPFSVSYLGTWTPPGTELSGALTVLHNVAGGSNGSRDDFSRARIGAGAAYNILRLAASLTKALPADWQLRAIVNGQYSSDALIPGEQFGAGGSTSVRGLRERELSNDSGVGTNLELYTPNLCAARAGWNCRALAFYDSAYLRRNKELAGELHSTLVGSVGVGLRLLISTHVNLQIDYGHVVKAGATNVGDANRLHFRLGFSY